MVVKDLCLAVLFPFPTKFDIHLADFMPRLRYNYLFLSTSFQNVLTVINCRWVVFSVVGRRSQKTKKKKREKKNTGKISIVFYNITENKPGDETCSVFKALTYIFFSLLSPAQFTGFIFSLIKNSPSCSSQQFSQGCRITSEKFGEMNRPVKWLTLSLHLKISVQHTKLHKAVSGFRQWIFFLFG